MESILNEVIKERKNQINKWGEQNHKVIEWIAILTEEVGEASKEAVDYHFKNPYKEEDGSLSMATPYDQDNRIKSYRKELIQVAAVAIQMIECLDRNGE